MVKGELQKRLFIPKEVMRCYPTAKQLNDAIQEVLDEVRKEFPLKVNRQGLEITLMTTPKLTKDEKKVIKIVEWFLKWFGDKHG